ncbi:MAG: hypothetical protein ACK5H0_10435 [Bacteroidota bacterium]|jgi:hypothetical protein
MKGHIPIPEGLKLPKDAEEKPFTAEVEFLVMDGMLMPVSVAGRPIAQEAPEMEEEGGEEMEEGEMEEGAEGEAEGEEEEGGEMCGECGGDKKKCRCGKMGGEDKGAPEGGGFMIAIERALAQPKR